MLTVDGFAITTRSMPRPCRLAIATRRRGGLTSAPPRAEMGDGIDYPQDLELVRAVRAGDPRAVEQFVERMSFTACALRGLNRRLGGPLSGEDLDDLTQDILVSLWPRLAQYNGASALETWIYGFCFNGIMNAVRKGRRRGRQEPFEDDRPARVESAPDSEELALVRSAMADLEERYERVIRLRFYEELSFEQIGARLALSTNTAKTNFYRGLKRLGELLMRPRRGA